MQELTSLCERQQSELVEAARRARELQRLASAAKKSARLAEDQVHRSFGRGSEAREGGFSSLHGPIQARMWICLDHDGSSKHACVVSTCNIFQCRHRRAVL